MLPQPEDWSQTNVLPMERLGPHDMSAPRMTQASRRDRWCELSLKDFETRFGHRLLDHRIECSILLSLRHLRPCGGQLEVYTD
jgi:hypothetical protein